MRWWFVGGLGLEIKGVIFYVFDLIPLWIVRINFRINKNQK